MLSHALTHPQRILSTARRAAHAHSSELVHPPLQAWQAQPWCSAIRGAPPCATYAVRAPTRQKSLALAPRGFCPPASGCGLLPTAAETCTPASASCSCRPPPQPPRLCTRCTPAGSHFCWWHTAPCSASAPRSTYPPASRTTAPRAAAHRRLHQSRLQLRAAPAPAAPLPATLRERALLVRCAPLGAVVPSTYRPFIPMT
mmetsp:Transcript_56348/g.125751  ORF Transcript_56348/g.125751 Transcript_56348/m.125751 type:complete len:200 (-) Transcript_56348:834-1433(-)